jgi:hypothetical protein
VTVAVPPELVTPHGRRLKEPRSAHVITSEGPDGHTHCASIDPEGDGRTTPGGRDGHTHAVTGLEIERAADGHRHELGAERCRGHGRGQRRRCLP